MATEILPYRVASVYGEQASLTSAALVVPAPAGRDGEPCRGALIKSTADFRFQIVPRLEQFLKTTDIGVTYTDYSDNVRDRDAATVATLSSLGTFANGDWVLVGAKKPFGGIAITMTAAVNGTASVLTGMYHNGTAWADITATDGTANSGATFGQTGQITWTTPAAWAKNTIKGMELFWVLLKVSAALDSTTTVATATLLGKDSNRGYGYASTLYSIPLGPYDNAIEALTASTATLDITWMFGGVI
jgi:hypothetical protein